ncbi:MAG: hypothetical protein ACTHJP_09205, partial [Rhodanobacteraceae bacterium]
MSRATVAVLGAGSWGTALAALLCGNGIATRLWGRDAGALARIAASHRNQQYLPDLELPPELACVPDLAEALRGGGPPAGAGAGHPGPPKRPPPPP